MVTLIMPGFVRTNIAHAALQGDGSPQGTMDKAIASGITPEKAAEHILKGVSLGKEEVVFGGLPERTALAIMRISPRFYSAVAKKMNIE